MARIAQGGRHRPGPGSGAGLAGDRPQRPDGGAVHQGRGGRRGGGALQVRPRQLPDGGGRFGHALAAQADRPQRAGRRHRSVRGLVGWGRVFEAHGLDRWASKTRPHPTRRPKRPNRGEIIPVRGWRMSDLFSYCPGPPDYRLRWEEMRAAYEWLRALDGCPHDPVYHAEGDVAIHTRMVCDELLALPAWRALPEDGRQVLFAAAVLHDVAKP